MQVNILLKKDFKRFIYISVVWSLRKNAIGSFVVLKAFDSKQLANTAHGVSDVRKNIGLSIKVCEISM